MQYNWKYRKYRNGKKVSGSFDAVVPKSIDVKITKDMILSHTGLNTPIRGVSIVPYADHPELTNLFRQLSPQSNSYEYVWSEFKQSIFENWNENKIHVIGTSSGYDSRMIAKAVQELTKEHGTGWLGETYFVECGGESLGFKEVMKALGFKNYIIWEPDYDFSHFREIHNKFNGLCAYPINQWYDFYVKNWNEEEIQYISGFGGNVADAMRSHPRPTIETRLRLYFQNQYMYQLAAFKQPEYSFHPFWSWRYIKATCGMQHKEKRTSRFLSRMFVPECEHIPRMTILGDVKGLGYLTLKEKVVKELYDWYICTDYGRMNNMHPSSQIEYNRWWLQFCIADYIESRKK